MSNKEVHLYSTRFELWQGDNYIGLYRTSSMAQKPAEASVRPLIEYRAEYSGASLSWVAQESKSLKRLFIAQKNGETQTTDFYIVEVTV